MRPYLFNFEIDVSDRECDRFEPQWANYGLIEAYGDTLEELLDNASVNISDQDGGELDIVPADEPWMQELIATKFRTLGPMAALDARLEAQGDSQLQDATEREASDE